MTEAEALFLSTLHDLGRRVDSEDPYEILGASALIRKLLIGSHPLLDQVNQSHRLKLRFRVGLPLARPPGFPEPVVWSLQDGLDPHTGVPGHQVVDMTRDRLLSTPVLKIAGGTYTVRDVVLFEANVMGGVHAGAPIEQREKALAEVNRLFALGGYRASLRQLKAIGRVVLYGLKPLHVAIKASS